MAELFIRGDLLDAYARLVRLRNRFKAEKHDLNPAALAALSKVFEHDTFIKGMINIRQIGEHVKKHGDELVIWTTGTAPITLDAESSAMAFFSASTVFLNDTDGNPHRLDHLEMLKETEKRIAAAMTKARL